MFCNYQMLTYLIAFTLTHLLSISEPPCNKNVNLLHTTSTRLILWNTTIQYTTANSLESFLPSLTGIATFMELLLPSALIINYYNPFLYTLSYLLTIFSGYRNLPNLISRFSISLDKTTLLQNPCRANLSLLTTLFLPIFQSSHLL